MTTYPTEGARIHAETGKTAMQLVIEEACDNEDCRTTMGLDTNRYVNMVGGRPSDGARSAARAHNRDGCEKYRENYVRTWKQINGGR